MGNTTSTFDIEKSCKANNETLNISDCLPSFIFDSSNHVIGVSSLGGIPRGELKTEPDVAGIGVLLAFIIPSVTALAIGALLAIRPVNDQLLPEILQIQFIKRIAPARSQRRRLQYKGPPQVFHRRHRENYTNNKESNHPTHPYPSTEVFNLQSHRRNYSEHHGLAHSPYQTNTFTGGSNSGDIESMNSLTSHSLETPPLPSPTYPADDDTLDPVEDKPASERIYDMLQAALQSITDSQILLSLAFNLSFRIQSKCGMSLYHFRLALNITEVACANAFLSILLIRDYWRAPVSAILRLLVLGIDIWLAYDILNVQRGIGYTAEVLPPPERNDSLILMKAFCFLDKDLAEAVFGNYTNASLANSTRQFSAAVLTNLTTQRSLLTQEEYGIVGALDYTSNPREWAIVLVLWLSFGLALLYGLIRRVRSRTGYGWRDIFFYVYSSATWCFCLVVLCSNASYIFALRRWVGGSGWFGGESENYVGLGQWMAITATAGIAFAFFDKLEVREG